MSQKLYKNYTDDIAYYLKEGKRRKQNITESFQGFNGLSGVETSMPWLDTRRKELNFQSLQSLSSISGRKANYHQRLGAHPDFSYLKDANQVEYHYITTMFIDIRKSTDLFKKYDPIAVARITRTIQDAAIHTCWYFDGYVHRLQGDGLMIYFGGKNVSISDSTSQALTAASFISYFVKNDLKELFNENGVKNIYTRIGIDLGEKDDVLWHLAGMGECSEITTCSLHSSLASKMQNQAGINGVITGDHIIKHTSVSKQLFKHKRYENEEGVSDFVFSIEDEGFYYKQHEFDWNTFLQRHSQVVTNADGSISFIGEPILPKPAEVERNLPYLKKNVEDYKPYNK